MGIYEIREAEKQIGHFISPFAAGHKNDDLSIRPFRQLVLDDCLSTAKGAWYASCSSLSQRKESVENSLAGRERLIGHEALLDIPVFADGPSLKHLDLFDSA